MTDSKTYSYKTFDAELIEEDLFCITFNENTVCDVEDFEASVEAYVQLGEGRIIRVLAIFPSFTDITPNAREFLQERKIPAIAEAVVMQSLGQKLIFSFYKAFRSKKYPVKGFTSVEAALQWLDSYK